MEYGSEEVMDESRKYVSLAQGNYASTANHACSVDSKSEQSQTMNNALPFGDSRIRIWPKIEPKSESDYVDCAVVSGAYYAPTHAQGFTFSRSESWVGNCCYGNGPMMPQFGDRNHGTQSLHGSYNWDLGGMSGEHVKIKQEVGLPLTMSLWGRIQQLPPEALTQVRNVYRVFPIKVGLPLTMSLWGRIQQLPPEALTQAQNVYREFPIEVGLPLTMSLWGRIQQLPSEALTQVRNVYRVFPIEVQHYLCIAVGLLPTMSLWGRIQQLPPEALTQVRNVYREFPIEVRHHLAQWVEEQPWKELDENNPAHEQFAQQLLMQLVNQLEERAGSSVEFINRFTIQNNAAKFKETYRDQPLQLVRIIKQCLAKEEEIVKMAEMNMVSESGLLDGSQGLSPWIQEIQRKLEEFGKQTEHTDVFLKDMRRIQENFVVDYENQLQLSGRINQMKAQQPNNTEAINRLQGQKDNMDRDLLNAAHKILQQRIELAGTHKMTLGGLEGLQKKIVEEELLNWKRNQQLAGNGAAFDPMQIDVIQKWCESLVELVWKNRQQIIQVDLLIQQLPIDVPDGIPNVQPELNQIATGLLSSLVTSTFIVEQQPPQVLKKDSRFSATVRLLVGGKLNLHMSPPRVKATIISEQQARGLLQNDEGKRQQKSGDILNDTGAMEYHQHTGVLSITFRNMALKNIRRADRRGAEVHTVAEEKFCILFSSDFNVGGNELKFQVWTLSLPVVVTVHGNQECQATATYLWDNQFSAPGRIPFIVPDTVPWTEIAKMLSVKFQSMTGRGLSDSNLRYLFFKLFPDYPEGQDISSAVITWSQFNKLFPDYPEGQDISSAVITWSQFNKLFPDYPEGQDISSAVITWSQFNKENLLARNFTFWEWFWSVAKLVKEHLKGAWNDQLIIGFMDKSESQEKLLSKPNGTFLLRFSDGTQGGITIAWVADHPEKMGERQVWNLAPFTIKDFQIRGLADRVKDLSSLVLLYPDIPKDRVFSKYYSPPTDPPPNLTKDGYVKTTLINVIDAIPGAGVMSMENPQTPQAYNGPGSPAQSFNAQPTTPGMLDAQMDGEHDPTGMLLGQPDYGQDDLDYNRLNEWLSQNALMNTT